jgi:hypothetical protein
MPTVPIYKRSVEQAALPNVRGTAALTPEAAGVGAGKAISAAAALYYEDELLRQDQVAFLEADRKLSEWENKTLYDPQAGALNKRGKDAFGLPDTVGSEYQKMVDDTRKGLSTERQRIAFDRAAEARRDGINKTLSRHVFQEARKFEEAETENYVLNAQQAAVANYHDPDRVALEIERARAAVVGFAKRNGLGAEYTKQKMAQIVSNTHVNVIDRFLANGQDQGAQKYFDANRGVIAGDDIAKVEQKLQIATAEGEGLRGAIAVWDKSGPKSDLDPVQGDKLFKDAEGLYADNPRLLKSVKQHLTERMNLHNSAQRERAEASASKVWVAVEQRAPLARIQMMPEYLALPGKQRNEITQFVIQRGRSDQQWADAHGSDGATYYNLFSQATTPALQETFAQTNLLDYRTKLSKGEFTRLVELQGAIRKGDEKNLAKLTASERVQTQMVNEALISMKLDPTPNEKSPKHVRDNVVAFKRTVREAVAALEARQGKNATDEQVQGIVDAFVIEGVTKPGVLWNDTKRVYQLQPGEDIIIKPTDVPRSERAKIEAALRANNRAVTDEAVTELYRQKLLRMRGTAAPAPSMVDQVPR